MYNYTRNECALFNLLPECILLYLETRNHLFLYEHLRSSECSFTSTLVSSVILNLLHSFRVYFSIFSTRFECILHVDEVQRMLYVPWILREHQRTEYFCLGTTCTYLPHSFRVYFHIFSTRFECNVHIFPNVWSVLSHILHSFRVYDHIFFTRLKCIFAPSPLVSSVVFTSSPLVSSVVFTECFHLPRTQNARVNALVFREA
jgi:hypothetical protein